MQVGTPFWLSGEQMKPLAARLSETGLTNYRHLKRGQPLVNWFGKDDAIEGFRFTCLERRLI